VVSMVQSLVSMKVWLVGWLVGWVVCGMWLGDELLFQFLPVNIRMLPGLYTNSANRIASFEEHGSSSYGTRRCWAKDVA